ncbi:hypothetical protein [Falsibacillus pallidus]|uniref:hypothetical protein n=1 Tax=Falsibacillus pallidus TaxID=493781 RepID=UPI003D99B96F
MIELDWFVRTLEGNFKVKGVDIKQIGHEANEMYLDEIDESLLPNESIDNLPEALIFETMVVEDSKGVEWIGIIGVHPETRDWVIQIILKDGDPVHKELVEKENRQ